MDWSIGNRIKARSRDRQAVQKKKKEELEAASPPPAKTRATKRWRRRRSIDTYSDIEEVVIPAVPVPKQDAQKSFGQGKETHLEEDVSRSKKLIVEEYVHEEVVVTISDYELENDVKDGMSSDGLMSSEDEDEASDSKEEDEEEEDSDDTEDEDYRTVESESSMILSSSSSSSSDDDYYHFNQENSIREKVGDTDDGHSNVASTSKKPVQTGRKSSGRTKRNEKKMKQKPRKKQKRETKQPRNIMVTCAHCGNVASDIADCDNSFTTTSAVKAAGEDLNKLASTNASRAKCSTSISSGRKIQIPLPTATKATDEDLNKCAWTEVAEAKVSVPTSSNRMSESPPATVRGADDDLNKLASTNASRAKYSCSISSGRKFQIQLPTATKAKDEDLNKCAWTEVAEAKDSVPTSSNRMSESPPATVRAADEDLNKVASTNVSRAEASVSVCSDREYRKQQVVMTEIEHSPKGKKSTATKSSGWRVVGGPPKDLDVFGLLVNSVWGNQKIGVEEHDSSPPKEDIQEQEEMNSGHKYGADGLLLVKPPPLVLKFKFGEEEPEPEPVISEAERENLQLFEELAFILKSGEAVVGVSSNIPVEPTADEHPLARCERGCHNLYLDLEIGLKCIHCGFVETEIRDMDISEWQGDIHTNRRRRMDRLERDDNTLFEKLGFHGLLKNSSADCGSASEGTVWDVIPGTKSQLYPHQQEGFEFIWKNLEGTIVRDELKDFERSDKTGGCIISHAPGTGKTRLTIVFLQSYMELFPNCTPMIIAPASLLLTWEEEFKKWNMGVPFHNLNNLEFSGKEDSMAVNIYEQRKQSSRSHNLIRMVKLSSWSEEKSILGISYNLFEKLAGDDVDKGKKKKKEVILNKEREQMRKILLEKPGLVVLDEAHTPRSQRSCIWKTLTVLTTQKRILLSGTPFQNNFLELCNVLCVARPAYLSMFSSMLKKRKMKILRRERQKDSSDSAAAVKINDGGIEELKSLMNPFVHVHKGSILQKNLPGLRDCVVVLNPPALQKRILEAIPDSKNVFEVDHKRSVVSIHPSLVSCCTLSNKERSVLDETLLDRLRRSRLEPNESVKTRFLMEFIRLCDAINERVLVFSQYIDPLSLVMEQLRCIFDWTEGREVFYLHGKLDQKQRQLLINKFNNPKSEAKVILASIKACSEGINLVGASRVILLDVVWNPAVERQAISRAYRIGQKRMVYTYHLVMKGSLECQKYCQQAEKHRISELVFSSQHEKAKKKSSEAVPEDKVLDVMVQHVKLGDMFEKLIYQPKEADLVEGFSSVLQ